MPVGVGDYRFAEALHRLVHVRVRRQGVVVA
jgi:hypothetical protein